MQGFGHIVQNVAGLGVACAQELLHGACHVLTVEPARVQGLVGRPGQVFDAFQQIALGAQRCAVALGQWHGHRVGRGQGRLVQKAGVVQAHGLGQRTPEAGYPAGVETGERRQQSSHLLVPGYLAQGVQTVPYLGVLQFAEIPVDVQQKIAEVVGPLIHAQVPVQVGLAHHVPDLSLQKWQLGRVQGLALVVLVHELLQPGDVAVAVGGGHGRDQVVDDGGVGAAFGLGALAGVVDDEGVEEGHVFQRHLWIARVSQADALAGQPFHGAVFADVDHGVGLEDVPDPAVVGHVMVGGGQVWAVVDGDGVLAEPAGRLQTHKNIAQVDAGDGQVVTGAIDPARRWAPGLHQFLLHLLGEGVEPALVFPAADVTGGQPQLFFG